MTITQDDFDALKARIEELEANQGNYRIGPYEGANNIDRPDGEATEIKSLHQLHVFADKFTDPGGILENIYRRLEALEAKPSGDVVLPPEIPVDLVSSLKAMGFQFNADGTLGGIHLKSIGAPEGDFHAWLAASDGGFRFVSGWAMTGLPVPNDTVSNPNFPTTAWGTERDGNFFWDYFPAAAHGVSPNRPRKTLSMYLGGFVKGVGPESLVGKFIDFCSMEDGRGFRFNTFPVGGSPLGDIETQLELPAKT